MPITHIALVGHCGFDAGGLTRFANDVAPLCEVVRVNDRGALDKAATPGTLLLINRQLDGVFKTASGIDLVRELAQGEDAPAVMLVSNYADAQQQAVDAGALQGFGKSMIADTDTRHRIAELIASL